MVVAAYPTPSAASSAASVPTTAATMPPVDEPHFSLDPLPEPSHVSAFGSTSLLGLAAGVTVVVIVVGTGSTFVEVTTSGVGPSLVDVTTLVT